MANCYYVLATEDGTPLGIDNTTAFQAGTYVCACGKMAPVVNGLTSQSAATRLAPLPDLAELFPQSAAGILYPHVQTRELRPQTDVTETECS